MFPHGHNIRVYIYTLYIYTYNWAIECYRDGDEETTLSGMVLQATVTVPNRGPVLGIPWYTPGSD